ncbi:hypothetical protein [Actinomadura rugatobispora]|uniref:DUF4355 domain-containing protein n=1 Tax=Actinomadura rugatobispora TaxID=1994 RepID=A0ABW0ZQV7_9ACTN|nr:hypothetical protein GCM10010200_035940 [Actinomadura rugatobispora]
MTEQRIPPYAHALILAAAQEDRDVTTWTAREKELSDAYTEHQKRATAERDRIEARLAAARRETEQQLNALDQEGRRIASDLADAARRKDRHVTDAAEARRMVTDWCTRHGIDATALPAVDTGPLPAVPAEVAERRDLLRALTQEAVEAGTYGEPADPESWTVPGDLVTHATGGHPTIGEPVAGHATTTTTTDLPGRSSFRPGDGRPAQGDPGNTITDPAPAREDLNGDDQ